MYNDTVSICYWDFLAGQSESIQNSGANRVYNVFCLDHTIYKVMFAVSIEEWEMVMKCLFLCSGQVFLYSSILCFGEEVEWSSCSLWKGSEIYQRGPIQSKEP